MIDPEFVEGAVSELPARLRNDYSPCDGVADINNPANLFGDPPAWKGAILAGTLRAITDGLSKTILYGEAQGRVVNHVRELAYGFTGHGHVAANLAFDLSVPELIEDPLPYLNPFRGRGDGATRYSKHQHSSPHPSVVLFCMVDGSVRQLNRDIDGEVYTALATANKGEIVDTSSL